MNDIKIIALAQHLGVPTTNIAVDQKNIYSCLKGSHWLFKERYWVLTDEEVDVQCFKKFDADVAELKSDAPEYLQTYLDLSMYEDSIIKNSRDAILATYDERQREEIVDGITYFIYRIS